MQGALFKSEMRKAIRELRKDVTLRTDGLHEINKEPDKWHFVSKGVRDIHPVKVGDCLFQSNHELTRVLAVRPRYHVGQGAYIKEPWKTDIQHNRLKPREIPITATIKFSDARTFQDCWGKLRSPMFLRECFARDFILIKDVSASRLLEITNEDAVREGMSREIATFIGISVSPSEEEFNFTQARHIYLAYWDYINGKGSAAKNPWTWRIEFKPTKLDGKEIITR
jgi:hypothetical protein